MGEYDISLFADSPKKLSQFDNADRATIANLEMSDRIRLGTCGCKDIAITKDLLVVKLQL